MDKRYIFGEYFKHSDRHYALGSAVAPDPVTAFCLYMRQDRPHRAYEGRAFPADLDENQRDDLALDEGWYVKGAHEIPVDLPTPEPTRSMPCPVDALFREYPRVAFVASRETDASKWANRIKITEASLPALVKNAYALSHSQGLGALYFSPGHNLDPEVVEAILGGDSGYCRLRMDYVEGRAVKLSVHREGDDIFIDADQRRPWYDHTRADFAELLRLTLSEEEKALNAAVLPYYFGEPMTGEVST